MRRGRRYSTAGTYLLCSPLRSHIHQHGSLSLPHPLGQAQRDAQQARAEAEAERESAAREAAERKAAEAERIAAEVAAALAAHEAATAAKIEHAEAQANGKRGWGATCAMVGLAFANSVACVMASGQAGG